MLQNLIAYFSKEGYNVPGAAKAGLTDWEMMFLVSDNWATLGIQLKCVLVERGDHPVPDR